MSRWTPIRQPTTSLMLDAMIVGVAWACLTFFVVIGLLIYGAFRTPAKAHGEAHWIEERKLTDPVSGVFCCNLNDCQEERGVELVHGGFLIHSTGEVIESRRVIWRSPGGWWRCRNLTNGTTRCLIGAPPGT